MCSSSIAIAASPNAIAIQVWKDPNCGCCKDWIIHLEKNNFSLKVNDQGNNAARARLGMPQKFASCHTALVGGYVIEGHVPAEDIQRLLKEKPQALGLAVPGMPIGSPGMDGPVYGARRDAYQVLLIQKTDHQKFLTLTHEENMKNIQTKIATLLLTIGAALPLSSFSQAVMDHSKMNMSQMTPSLTDGEVKKIDLETGKVTIKHGEIKHMDMPGMTMVFTAKDKSLLTSIKPGEKIKFMVINEGGKMIVTDIQLVQ